MNRLDRASDQSGVPGTGERHLPAAGTHLYRRARLAAGYAFARPAVHQQVALRIAARLGISAGSQRRRGLDVGCGAGLSTAALCGLAEWVAGVDPAAPMLAHRRAVAPRACFAVAAVEALPFGDDTFDLVTCAGALNYADVDVALREIARVLAVSGTLVVYDFAAGRRSRGREELDRWFGEFEARYPYPTGYALDVASLDYRAAGLQLVSCEPFEIPMALGLDQYLAYVLSETNVEQAVAAGTPEEELRAWCRRTLEPLFDQGPLDVLFDGYVACVMPVAGNQ